MLHLLLSPPWFVFFKNRLFFFFLFTKHKLKRATRVRGSPWIQTWSRMALEQRKSTPRASIHPARGDFDLCESGRCSHEQLSFQHRASRCAQRTAPETTKQHGRLSRGTQSPSCQTCACVVALISCSSIELKCKAPLQGRSDDEATLSSVAKCALQSLHSALQCLIKRKITAV